MTLWVSAFNCTETHIFSLTTFNRHFAIMQLALAVLHVSDNWQAWLQLTDWVTNWIRLEPNSWRCVLCVYLFLIANAPMSVQILQNQSQIKFAWIIARLAKWQVNALKNPPDWQEENKVWSVEFPHWPHIQRHGYTDCAIDCQMVNERSKEPVWSTATARVHKSYDTL